MKHIVEQSVISYELAELLIKESIKHAQFINLAISVSIVDSVGNLVAFARMDNANLIGVGTSQGKAFTAARSGLNTRQFADFLKSHQIELESLKNENLLPIPGGIPIFFHEKLIGGIGIGGGTGEQDESCARAALEILS